MIRASSEQLTVFANWPFTLLAVEAELSILTNG